MGDMNYLPLIEDMTWSYTRIKAYDECPYRFFLKYITHDKEQPMFYSDYGGFIHRLIEKRLKGLISKEQMLDEFLTTYQDNVLGERPKASTVEKYIQNATDFINSFDGFPDFNIVDVEKKVDFTINGLRFVGIIDVVAEKDGEYYIIDHKSRDLKPRSTRKTPTRKDEELDEMLKQLYIYSYIIKEEYGKFPIALCFNCYRTQTFVVEPFKEEVFQETIQWVKEKVDEIKRDDTFKAYPEYFACRFICGVNYDCIYYGM